MKKTDQKEKPLPEVPIAPPEEVPVPEPVTPSIPPEIIPSPEEPNITPVEPNNAK